MTITPNRINWTAQAPPVPSAQIMQITPEMAASWLVRNINNRPVRKSHVVRLAHDMSNGRWHVSPDAITFDAAGNLANGQHRLHAIIKSGATIEALVMTDAPAETYAITDDGVRRSLADYLCHLGYSNTVATSACVSLIYTWEKAGHPAETGTVLQAVTRQELLDRFLADADAFVAAAAAGRRLHRQVGLSAAWWSACSFKWTAVDAEDAAFWEHAVGHGQTLDGEALLGSHPAMVLRDTIARDAMQNRQALKHNRKLSLALMVKAWNAYRAGEPIALLKFRTGGAKPETFPVVQ